MSIEERKILLTEQLHVIIDDINDIYSTPTKILISKVIWDLFEVMRQLADWSDEHIRRD